MKKNKTLQLSEVQVSYSNITPMSERPTINTSRDAYELLKATWDYSTIELFEEFKIILLNRANKVLGISTVSQGGTAGTVVDAKMIFVRAIKCNCSSIVLSHNHPSSNLKPSSADKAITIKLREGARLLDIEVIDHIIITKESYYSFADEGII